MKTGTRPDDLEILGHLLQADLQSKLSQSVPVKVRCFRKDETLVILVQHRAGVEPDPQQIFSFLEEIILAEYQSISSQVKIYLRVAGQQLPYASHSFMTEPLSESTATDYPAPVEKELDSPTIPSPLTPEEIDSDPVEADFTDDTDTPTGDSALLHPWDQPISESESENQAVGTPEASDEAPAEKALLKQSLLPLIITGVGLSLVIFSGSLYVLSRPCVIGPCKAIPQAEELSQRSATTLQNPQSGKEVLEAQQQLNDAIRMLESIPVWSSQHGKAQELIKTYQAQAERVDDMVRALKTAARAAYKSESPPHPVSKWIEIQSLWREAIAQLEQLPSQSNFQPLVQQKIKAYKLNLAQTNQRLVKEREAQGYLQAAKDAALIAEARQGVAQSLPHWQLVYSTWQMAMKRLKQIPQGTTAYEEAKQLTGLYLPKMASARDRKTEEQIATNAYNQGLYLAQLARTSQASNQWSVALNQWRNALTYVNQVPSGTFYYSKAQSLVNPYTNALKQAQGELQVAVQLQQVRNDLLQTCSGKAKVCNYTIDKNLITVRLTPAYVELVRQAALNAQSRNDSNVQSGIVNHVLTLGQALETISDNSRIPMQVYSPEGSMIKEHVPGR